MAGVDGRWIDLRHAAWQAPSPATALAPGHVDIWRVELGRCRAHSDALLDALPDSEATPALLFHDEDDRLAHVVQRALVRHVVRHYVGGDPDLDWDGVRRRVRGAPLFVDVAVTPAVAVCAVSAGQPVGCGVQPGTVVGYLDDILAAFATDDERHQFSDPGSTARELRAPRWWAAKKAVALARAQPSFSVLPDRQVILADSAMLLPDGGWTAVEVHPADGHVGVVAVEGGVEDVRLFSWEPPPAKGGRDEARARTLVEEFVARRPAFVDLHSHVVPSGDDGFVDLAVSERVCAEAGERGTHVQYGTPHISATYPIDGPRRDRIEANYQSLRRRLDVDLRLGFEVTPADFVFDEHPDGYRLAGTDAVLVECDPWIAYDEFLRLARWVEQAGLTPLVAHPERSMVLAASPALGDELRDAGWPLQVSGGALFGRYGPMIGLQAWRLIDSGMANVVASDSHSPDSAPFLDVMYALVEERIGPTRAAPLFTGAAVGLAAS